MAAHAVVPSWSVNVMPGVGLMNSGEMTFSASPPLFSFGQTVTEAMAAAGSPSQKQENRRKRPGGPSVTASKTGGVLRLCQGRMWMRSQGNVTTGR